MRGGVERSRCSGRPESLRYLLDLYIFLLTITPDRRAGSRCIWRSRRKWTLRHGRKCKQVNARIHLPKGPAAHKHVGPALAAKLALLDPYIRLLGSNQAHALQFRQHHLAFEYAFSVDRDTPFSLRFPCIRRALGYRVGYPQFWLRLVKVPVQSGPKHHGDLPGG